MEDVFIVQANGSIHNQLVTASGVDWSHTWECWLDALQRVSPEPYISVRVRCGDVFLETLVQRLEEGDADPDTA